jgi:hypothetical protein
MLLRVTHAYTIKVTVTHFARKHTHTHINTHTHTHAHIIRISTGASVEYFFVQRG